VTKCFALSGGADEHTHDVWIDPRTGNGRADPGGNGHMHEIIRWNVQPADDGHTHALACPAGTGGGLGQGAGG
jgi:hypothetical protein